MRRQAWIGGVALVALVGLIGCSHPSDPPPAADGGGMDAGISPDAGPSLTLSPKATTIVAGSGQASFVATVAGSSAPVTWSLSPSGQGSLQLGSAGTALYTAPQSVGASAQTVLVIAQITGTSVQDSATVTVLPSGALSVKVIAPTGLAPQVSVSGPGLPATAIPATQTLQGLAVGSYTVTANPVEIQGVLTSLVYPAQVIGSPAQVTPGGTATVTVTYAVRGGTGMLWVPDWSDGALYGYSESQLLSNDAGAPMVRLGMVDAGRFPEAIAFDSQGDLWLASSGRTLLELTPDQLTQSGTPKPAVVIGDAFLDSDAGIDSLNGPLDLAFDGDGGLWVANCDDPTRRALSPLVRFDPGQLTTSGSPRPSTVVYVSGLYCPKGLAFDRYGNLWVTDRDSRHDSWVGSLSPQQLQASGTVSPANILSADAGSLEMYGLAFDPSGALWVASCSSQDQVDEFTPGQLGQSGWVPPALSIESFWDGGTRYMTCGTNVGFDLQSNLWVIDRGASQSHLFEYSALTLGDGGSLIPTFTGILPITDQSKFAFDPPPAALPIFR